MMHSVHCITGGSRLIPTNSTKVFFGWAMRNNTRVICVWFPHGGFVSDFRLSIFGSAGTHLRTTFVTPFFLHFFLRAWTLIIISTGTRSVRRGGGVPLLPNQRAFWLFFRLVQQHVSYGCLKWADLRIWGQHENEGHRRKTSGFVGARQPAVWSASHSKPETSHKSVSDLWEIGQKPEIKMLVTSLGVDFSCTNCSMILADSN